MGSITAARETVHRNGCPNPPPKKKDDVTALKFQSLNTVELARRILISRAENGYCFSLFRVKQPKITYFDTFGGFVSSLSSFRKWLYFIKLICHQGPSALRDLGIIL
jgi:hypothetical protein